MASQALLQYQTIVKQYINENCKDSNKIAYTLDFMLDFCFDSRILLLYRQLCRHLYTIDSAAAVHYVQAYREMWDEEGKMFGKKEDIKKEA